jgi:sarcosine oxidase subunit gamma
MPMSLVRVHRTDAELVDALGRAFGVSWPVEPNTTAAGRGFVVLWLTPTQWAITGLSSAEAGRCVAEACGNKLHLVSDVTDGRALFEISGERARDLLAKGCSLDLHEREFPVGACAQTLLAQAAVLLYRSAEDPQTLQMYVDTSVAEHLRRWLCDAALEFSRE